MKDGYDVQMQTNHISHFLLTKELLGFVVQGLGFGDEAAGAACSNSGRSGKPVAKGFGDLPFIFLGGGNVLLKILLKAVWPQTGFLLETPPASSYRCSVVVIAATGVAVLILAVVVVVVTWWSSSSPLSPSW